MYISQMMDHSQTPNAAFLSRDYCGLRTLTFHTVTLLLMPGGRSNYGKPFKCRTYNIFTNHVYTPHASLDFETTLLNITILYVYEGGRTYY